MQDLQLIDLPYEPQQRQILLHNSKCRQIIYGGAAGGGKSVASRWDLIRFALRNPGFQGYLFRESRRMLESTHIRPMKQLFKKFPQIEGSYNGQRNAAEFGNGSVIYMCFCASVDDAYDYLSEEMHALVLDEASRMDPNAIAMLKTRVRLGSFRPALDAERLPRFVMATNPGGPSHTYIKRLKDMAPPETVFYDAQMSAGPHDPGWTSVFIPSKMGDNVYLDKDYGGAFGMLSPEQQKAYREGDWDAVVGAALHNLSRDVHCLGRFKPPAHWLRFCSMDWGMVRPFAIGWYAVCDDDVTMRFHNRDVFIPRGAVILYRELYGWGGKENTGSCWPPARVAAEIKAVEVGDRAPAYRVADTEIWAQHGGPTVAEQFNEAGIYFQKAHKDRTRNYQEVICRLAGYGEFDASGRNTDRPMFFITEDCTHWWRTAPTLLFDPLEPEKGPGTKNAEDHHYDQTAYALRSRPWIAQPEDDDDPIEEAAPYTRAA